MLRLKLFFKGWKNAWTSNLKWCNHVVSVPLKKFLELFGPKTLIVSIFRPTPSMERSVQC